MHDYEEYGNIATAMVTVVGTPDAPHAYLSTPADNSFYAANVVIPFSADVYDADGNDTIVNVVFETTNGITIGVGVYNGTNTYFLDSELISGVHSWRVVATDDIGLAVTSTVRTITIDGNIPPIANAGTNHYVAAYQLAPLDGSGSSDPDNAQETLSFLWSQIGGAGVTVLNPTNMVASYMPEASGPHTFQLIVSDAEYSRTATVVHTVNILPVADDISVQTPENTAYIVIPTYNDPDGPGPYEFVSVTEPIYGSLGLCDGESFIYIPDELAGGVIDHFDYVVQDGIGQSAPATISILIGELNKPNVLPYRESFESFRPGFTILGRHGWMATDPEAAYISTNAAALSALAGYAGTYPISTTHDQLIAIQEAVTNEVDTSNLAGEDIVIDFMVMPSRWDLDEPPLATADNQFGLYFNTNGTIVVWARPASAAPAGWQVLTNAASLATNTWARLAIEQRYSAGEQVFRVMLDGGLPIEDDMIGQVIDPDTEKCWFIMDDQSKNYMSRLAIAGQSYMDDMTASLSDTNSFLGWLVDAYPGNTNYNEAAGE
ncbi:MAG: hypothetical protein KAI74_05135, partial [Kiritimatiellae bacterium]|nr:hypothetical protein [Kiritimatiellia bacterium]